MIYSPPVQHADHTLGVTAGSFILARQSTRVDVKVSHGSADRGLRLAAFPLSNKPLLRSIFVYNDPSYPTANTIPTVGEGVFDNLAGELVSRNYPFPVVAVKADSLRDTLMAIADANHRTVVLMTGVLPSTVFARNLDLVTPWVQAGGLIVWGGGAIGYWSGTHGQPLGSTNVVGETGTERLLGKGIVTYPSTTNRVASAQGELASALDVSYKFASSGVLRGSVLARGGLTLGWYSGGFSSVSYLPQGLGGYLIFGGEIPEEVAVSRDVAHILLAGAVYGAGPVAAMDINLATTNAVSVVAWELPFPAGKAGVMLVAFGTDPDSVFFYSQTVGQ